MVALKDKYWTVTQAAKEFGVTRQTVSRWIKDGKLSADKVGRTVLINKEKARKWHHAWIAADGIEKLVYRMINDYCHKKFSVDDNEVFKKLRKKGKKWYIGLEKPDGSLRFAELPMPLEQFEKEWMEYTKPILGEHLKGFISTIKNDNSIKEEV